MSKLYTEEQVREIIDIAEFDRHLDSDEILNQFTPIELPTVIEIVSEASIYGKHCNIFSDGVNWTLDKIKGGNK